MNVLRVLAVATLGLACLHAEDKGAVPLYPNGQTTPLPRAEIARLEGPIAKIDGQDVSRQGGLFDLLPGCHVVELDTQTPPPSAHSSRIRWWGPYPVVTYALRMKPGADYRIHREAYSEVRPVGGPMVSAQEREASGAITDLAPASSDTDVNACKRGTVRLPLAVDAS